MSEYNPNVYPRRGLAELAVMVVGVLEMAYGSRDKAEEISQAFADRTAELRTQRLIYAIQSIQLPHA